MDLKLENILFDDDLNLKLCDFGFSQTSAEPVLNNKGTSGYKSPEISNEFWKGCSAISADIFALGVILFIFEFGIPPFTNANHGDLYYRYFTKTFELAKLFFRIHPATKDKFRKGELDPDLIILLTSMLNIDPKARP